MDPSSTSQEVILSPPKRAKRKNSNWGAKPKSHKDSVKNPASEALKKLETVPSNPFDELQHEKLKEFGVFMFFASQTAWPCEPISREDVYELVAANVGVSARTIRRWVSDFENNGKFGESEWGKNPRTRTVFDKVEFR